MTRKKLWPSVTGSGGRGKASVDGHMVSFDARQLPRGFPLAELSKVSYHYLWNSTSVFHSLHKYHLSVAGKQKQQLSCFIETRKTTLSFNVRLTKGGGKAQLSDCIRPGLSAWTPVCLWDPWIGGGDKIKQKNLSPHCISRAIIPDIF